MFLLLIGWPLLIAGLLVFGRMVWILLHPQLDDKPPPHWEVGGRVVSDLALSITLASVGLICLVLHWWN